MPQNQEKTFGKLFPCLTNNRLGPADVQSFVLFRLGYDHEPFTIKAGDVVRDPVGLLVHHARRSSGRSVIVKELRKEVYKNRFSVVPVPVKDPESPFPGGY